MEEIKRNVEIYKSQCGKGVPYVIMNTEALQKATNKLSHEGLILWLYLNTFGNGFKATIPCEFANYTIKELHDKGFISDDYSVFIDKVPQTKK